MYVLLGAALCIRPVSCYQRQPFPLSSAVQVDSRTVANGMERDVQGRHLYTAHLSSLVGVFVTILPSGPPIPQNTV